MWCKENRHLRLRKFFSFLNAKLRGYCNHYDIPGCVAGGDTLEEALEMAEDAKRAWLEIAIEDGKRIPEPSFNESTEFSGKFTLRLPKDLHRDLALG